MEKTTTLNQNSKLIEIGDICRLISACFLLPDKELFNQENLINNLVLLFNSNFKGGEKDTIKFANSFRDTVDEDLKVDYARLFVGPNELIAPPYGSVYLEKGYQVMGKTTIAVQNIYRDAGLVLDDSIKQPSDHISLELEFIYFLLFKELKAEEDNNSVDKLKWHNLQISFLDEYLSPWISEFAKNIRNGAETEFYISLADILEQFIDNLKQVISD